MSVALSDISEGLVMSTFDNLPSCCFLEELALRYDGICTWSFPDRYLNHSFIPKYITVFFY